MPLIDNLNNTRLRSLKFGNDRPGGGNSGQPYIKPVDLDKSEDNIRRIHFDEGFIRGGVVKATTESVTDLIRIGKFLTDFPKGPLFIAKQVGLQLSNPKLETREIPHLGITSNSNLLNMGFDAINKGIDVLNRNSIGPTRIYNLGINTLAQIPLTAFGGHIQRHGFSPFRNEDNNYYNIVKNKSTNENRLVQLGYRLIDSNSSIEKKKLDKTFFDKLVKTITLNTPIFNKDKNGSDVIDDYVGGPNSTYGIGRTVIRRYENTNNARNFRNSFHFEGVNYANALVISHPDKNNLFTRSNVEDNTGINLDNPTRKPKQIDQSIVIYSNSTNKKYAELLKQNQIQYKKDKDTVVNEFGFIETHHSGSHTSTSYKDNGRNYIAYQNPQTGKVLKIKGNWRTLNREARIGQPGNVDLINLTPLFESTSPVSKTIKVAGGLISVRDLIKFRIEAVDNDNPNKSVWMIFRAYLENFTDSHNPEWNEFRYIGRGEKFYNYNGIERRVNLKFKVAALSAAEMEVMYQKLNYLVANTNPDYSDLNLMRGPLTRLTVGNYLYRELSFINFLQYEVSQDTPWEIAIDEPEGGKLMYELPHIIDVNMSFSIIHNFLPQKSISESPFILNKPSEEITGEGAEKVDNPWLKEKAPNGKYTTNPLKAKNI